MSEEKKFKVLKKAVNKAFGRDIVLLLQRKDNTFVWLEAPRWDCEWYWGFGYLETYTNNRHPEDSNDIREHTHVDSVLWSERNGGKYSHHFNELPDIQGSVLSEKESWVLADLFKQFYYWQHVAAALHSGTAHLTGDEEARVIAATSGKVPGGPFYKLVNGVVIPRIMQRIMDRLHPEGKYPAIECPFLLEEMNALYDMKVLDLV